jgi:hypothetical protein
MNEELTREDWQFIDYATRERFNKARPKPSEGKPSKAFLEQEKRIMIFLTKKAFGP